MTDKPMTLPEKCRAALQIARNATWQPSPILARAYLRDLRAACENIIRDIDAELQKSVPYSSVDEACAVTDEKIERVFPPKGEI